MGYIILVVVLLAVLVVRRQLSKPRFQDAVLLATPLGAYMRARDNGASPAAAMMEGLGGLRYREPWSRISDGELVSAVGVLASARTTEPFKRFILTLERTRDPSYARDPNFLLALLAAEAPTGAPNSGSPPGEAVRPSESDASAMGAPAESAEDARSIQKEFWIESMRQLAHRAPRTIEEGRLQNLAYMLRWGRERGLPWSTAYEDLRAEFPTLPSASEMEVRVNAVQLLPNHRGA